MKTCKDCIYYLMDKDRSYTTDTEGYCHLHPVPTATYDEHWCGQLKGKETDKLDNLAKYQYYKQYCANLKDVIRGICKADPDLPSPESYFQIAETDFRKTL